MNLFIWLSVVACALPHDCVYISLWIPRPVSTKTQTHTNITNLLVQTAVDEDVLKWILM